MKTRRDFLKTAGFVSAGFLGLQKLSLAHGTATGKGTSVSTQLPMKQVSGYGPLVADSAKIFDLPKGFSYQVIATQGETLDDGFLLPGDPDGMAAFGTTDGRVALICNHELSADEKEKGPFGADNRLLPERSAPTIYDRGRGQAPHQGGTSTLIYDPKTGKKDLHYLSLAGTERNCAGGPTPWNSWITCEETNTKAGAIFEQDHGYNFEVPAHAHITHVDAVPLKAMGRFRHEAIAVEPRSGIVYQTEDMHDGLIYRFIPNQKGKLQHGGKLQALVIREHPSRDTRNWKTLKEEPFPVAELFETTWVDIDDVESPDDTLRYQGFDKGAARFARGEGMWYGNGEIYFACTNGGYIEQGQVFRYLPSPYEGTPREANFPGRLELFVESSNPDILKNCDNLTVAPNGHLLLCEDSDQPCKLIGITPQGAFYEFGSNRYTSSELAGACFSPDGNTLFINIQKNGQTLAITGPWEQFEA